MYKDKNLRLYCLPIILLYIFVQAWCKAIPLPLSRLKGSQNLIGILCNNMGAAYF